MSTTAEPTTHDGATQEGTYFVSNYPPYGAWSREGAREALAALDEAPDRARRLGLYVHIPFCRKRCSFCYFKVYTGKNSQDITNYIAAIAEEARLLALREAVTGRAPEFLYVGGGTPSYLSETHVRALLDALAPLTGGTAPPAFTFECEPGTISRGKLEALRDLGVTRLSFGVEHMDDEMLEANGRAHSRKQVLSTYALAREVGFDQINVDLLVGLAGETDEKWSKCVDDTIALDPDSVTLYQLELPANTVFAREGEVAEARFASWPTKRRWLQEAFGSLQRSGYQLTSAYTAVRDPSRAVFAYRDHVWRGDDLLALGVSAFSHLGGRHHQNEKHIEGYQTRVSRGELPISRGHSLTQAERLVRELVLGLKHGALDLGLVLGRHDTVMPQEVSDALERLEANDVLTREGDQLTLTEKGLLEIDRWLPLFFAPAYRRGP
jgi:oxygen-independent coproporphyrinogen-3 oxidase